ncbi:fatty acid desaturase [Erwiniaceae bacterium BAC15a-03b]|uniref:Fatty acid desaturase n=1 Tax=Winslowiella arboricola TaxID=2978220 RepID=A0A9J6PNB5_9GAMM|nr:fatty acid desaturase [Winslowiella arboricola]MCU5774343.1 fatty acid desaturase [Winslowiella arboricola]MCU5778890.1 fatty acid desaturase [Winslowiella arboricola]
MSTVNYLHQQQRAWIHQLSRSWLWRTELPTWILIVVIYGGWFATLAYWKTLGILPATLLLIWFTTWYMSLQHELIHGHPTRSAAFNQLLGLMPLAIWYPFGLYRDSHLQHHRDQHLTHPDEDPETYYFSAQRWQQFSGWQRRLVQLRNTLPGRVILGPASDIIQTLLSMLAAFAGRDWRAIAMWLTHGSLLMVVFAWMHAVDFPPGWFLLAVSYPALSLTKIRSFLEHRAADDPQARSVINEAAWPWRLLFLNLNYHSVHHNLPGVPWFALRKVYLAYRDSYLQLNHGFLTRGYREWLQRFLWRSVKVEVHPTMAGNHYPTDKMSAELHQKRDEQQTVV